MVILAKLWECQQHHSIEVGSCALVQVHDLKAFGAQNGDSGLQEDQVEGFRGEEEISVYSEPV